MATSILTAVTVSTGLAAGLAALRVGQRQGRLGFRSLAVSALVVAVAGCAVVALSPSFLELSPVRFSFWIAHVGYQIAVVSIPLTGLCWLIAKLRLGGSGWLWPVIVAAVIPAPVGFWATHVAPYQLQIERNEVVVSPSRAGDDQVRIAVVADLQTSHVSGYETEVIEKVMSLDADLILIPGDLMQSSDGLASERVMAMRKLLSGLSAPHGVYFAEGDVDGSGRLSDEYLKGTDIHDITSKSVELSIGDRKIRLAANELRYLSPASYKIREELQSTPGEDDVVILMSHRPDTVTYLESNSRVDLTVAGHTHGGQIVIPGFGPLFTASDVPREVGGGGLHQIDGNSIYVSRGIGMERGLAPQVRLFCPPEISVLTLSG